MQFEVFQKLLGILVFYHTFFTGTVGFDEMNQVMVQTFQVDATELTWYRGDGISHFNLNIVQLFRGVEVDENRTDFTDVVQHGVGVVAVRDEIVYDWFVFEYHLFQFIQVGFGFAAGMGFTDSIYASRFLFPRIVCLISTDSRIIDIYSWRITGT